MQYSHDILDNLSTAVIALGPDLQINFINPAAEVMFEASAARTVGLHASALILDNGKWIDDLSEALREQSPMALRGTALILHTGLEIHVDLMVTPMVSSSGDMQLLLELQAVDRLLRISREEGLLHAQETTRTVIRSLAHEIKNPLGGVRGAAQLLARELPTEELAEYTHIIIREADRLRDLVDRLLGSHQRLAVEQLNIHEVLEHVRNLLLAETDNTVEIERDYDPSLPEIPGDRSQLVQALLNIMRNALQAASNPEHCRITLRTRSQRQFTIGMQRHRLVCRVDIIDNGPGIPKDLQHAIFVPMISGRADGTGLGLSIAQSIANKHQGLLECESEPGNTRFTLFLPMESINETAR